MVGVAGTTGVTPPGGVSVTEGGVRYVGSASGNAPQGSCGVPGEIVASGMFSGVRVGSSNDNTVLGDAGVDNTPTTTTAVTNKMNVSALTYGVIR